MIVLFQSENRNIEMIATQSQETNRKKKNKWIFIKIVRDEKLSTTTPVIKVLCS